MLVLRAHGHKCHIVPERGGLIAACSLSGVSVLYMDQQTLQDPEASVRGGVPVLFPQAGVLESEVQNACGYDLQRHGFARLLPWQVLSQSDDIVSLQLVSSGQTRLQFPYDFVCTQTVCLVPQ